MCRSECCKLHCIALSLSVGRQLMCSQGSVTRRKIDTTWAANDVCIKWTSEMMKIMIHWNHRQLNGITWNWLMLAVQSRAVKWSRVDLAQIWNLVYSLMYQLRSEFNKYTSDHQLLSRCRFQQQKKSSTRHCSESPTKNRTERSAKQQNKTQ